MIDTTKYNFTQTLIKKNIGELDISGDDYYRALSISKDEYSGLHSKRQPNSCFVNNYFDVSLKAWKANMYIQLLFNEYGAVTYMC